jgi:deoxyribodipyrimidine photo-lyase
MEFENVNRAYDVLLNQKTKATSKLGKKEKRSHCRCLHAVLGSDRLYFRMRPWWCPFTFNLWQDWRELHFLARQFLDYEPGIHYPQIQMQSGTGINTIRFINSEDHDPDGVY